MAGFVARAAVAATVATTIPVINNAIPFAINNIANVTIKGAIFNLDVFIETILSMILEPDVSLARMISIGEIKLMGRTETPGVAMSIKRKVIPCCLGPSELVRTRQKIQSDLSAWEVHTF